GPGGEQREGSTKEEKASSFINMTLSGKTIVITAELALNESAFKQVYQGTQQIAMQAKGAADLLSARPRVQDLAKALKTYVEQHNGAFPPGTLDRGKDTSRMGVPWPPNQRMSWMAELLPYLGAGEYDGLYRQLTTNQDKSWKEGDNLLVASVPIPYYLC